MLVGRGFVPATASIGGAVPRDDWRRLHDRVGLHTLDVASVVRRKASSTGQLLGLIGNKTIGNVFRVSFEVSFERAGSYGSGNWSREDCKDNAQLKLVRAGSF